MTAKISLHCILKYKKEKNATCEVKVLESNTKHSRTKMTKIKLFYENAVAFDTEKFNFLNRGFQDAHSNIFSNNITIYD